MCLFQFLILIANNLSKCSLKQIQSTNNYQKYLSSKIVSTYQIQKFNQNRMSKRANKSIQKKDTKQVVLLPFSQQYNSQDSLFNEDNEILNSQYSNNIFSKPLNKDNIQFTAGTASSKALGLPNPLFENEWENNLNDIPIQKFKTNNLNNKTYNEVNKQNLNGNTIFGKRQNEIEQEAPNLDEEDDDEDEDMYEPEYLIDKRVVNGQIEYLVKWVEFSAEESTWEPAENIQVCAFDLIQLFEDSKKQTGNKQNTLSNNRSPMLTPTQRKQMHSPNLQKNSNLSQLRGRSPLRKSQPVTPQIKSGITQQEQSIKSPMYQKNNQASPLITYGKRIVNQNNKLNQKQLAEENLYLSNSIQSNQNSRVFDNKLQTENNSKSPNYGKTLTPKNNKKVEPLSDENIIKQVYNSQGEIIFEQKKMVKDDKQNSDKNKSPLLKLVKESAFYQNIVSNNNNNKTPQTTPNKLQDQSPFHTPVGKSQSKQNQNIPKSKSPINTANQTDYQKENNFHFQDKRYENQFTTESMNIEDNIDDQYVPAKRGRPAQNKRLEIPPSPIMTPTPNINDKSPVSKINRQRIYQDIQISDDLLKSPIQRATPLNKTQVYKENSIPQSPPILNDQIEFKQQQQQQSGRKKRLYKRIEISDHESSDIQNIEFLENRNNKYDDDILPVFQEYQKNTRSKGLSNNSRSQTISTSITPTKFQGNTTPNNQKSKTSIQNQQNSTPLNKNNQKENEKIQQELQQKAFMQQTTPNKKINSIWQYNKNTYQKDQITPNKNQQINVKTPLNNFQENEKTPQKNQSVKTPNKETRSPINKIDPKSPMSKQNKKSPLNKQDQKSPISKQNSKSPISKTMEVEENSKRKRRRQPSSISDDELNTFKQNQQLESLNQVITKSDLTPQKSLNQTPLKKGDLTPTRRSIRNKDDKSEQFDESKEKQIDDNSNQVHMKLRENRVQLQAQSEKINQALNYSRENLNNLNKVSFKIQQEEKEDLYSRVKKRVESIIQQNQQTSDQTTATSKKSKFETPVKEKTSSYEKITPESKSKNSRQGSAKKNKKIDPKTSIKKNDQRSATKEKQSIQILNNQPGKGQSQSENLSEQKVNSEQQSNETQFQSAVNESLQKGQKNKQIKNKKEEKNQQKDQEKQEKQNDLIEKPVEQNTNSINHLEITPKAESQKSRRVSQRLSNLKQDNSKEDKIQPNSIASNDQHNQVTTRRSQNNHKENEQNEQQDQFRTPVKSSGNNNQKVDPKGRLTRSSIKQNNNMTQKQANEVLFQEQDMEIEEQKQDCQVSNKNSERSANNQDFKQNQNQIDYSNISKIIGLLSQKKQKRGGKTSQNNNKEYPQFEVEMSNGEQKILNYAQIVEINPKMVADFLIKDYM
ncbi:chromo(CHRromatin organization modifier) domain protein (macronuclear) [Tetrahymena thermophila SB210]|uniref:Chromo(CHRromatin organization modifier) domain protein n=1 Tax=Tetrahymena thermophila (strain SB210) TaxID=312017 RepID=Q22EZ1_TETTS|nr:chromo(CHRromatin organization modifier) domain protein [Tetrahymena thermophila SB210]EAR83884.2 chromo(CHRromatin organization modifier) domain protein [Tetrahymena thermophila SB210]|eukprot:XP_001031547.2 chromo(CHRromatin organization modifier) domain protein [Tetrahymena thermophila SB210]